MERSPLVCLSVMQGGVFVSEVCSSLFKHSTLLNLGGGCRFRGRKRGVKMTNWRWKHMIACVVFAVILMEMKIKTAVKR